MMRKGLEVLESVGRRPPAEAWEIENAKNQFGEYLATLGRYDEAEPLLRDSYVELKTSLGSNTAQTYEALTRLISLYKAWGKPQKASEYEAIKRNGQAQSPYRPTVRQTSTTFSPRAQ